MYLILTLILMWLKDLAFFMNGEKISFASKISVPNLQEFLELTSPPTQVIFRKFLRPRRIRLRKKIKIWASFGRVASRC